VAVVGGGLAGLAAAAALAVRGCRVELFEAGKQLGGRAGSFLDPRAGHEVDFCQHIWMDCCTNMADLCVRAGLIDCFDRRERLWFIGPAGTRHIFSAARWLPAPLHLLPAVLRLGFLSLADRLHILRTTARLAAVGGEGGGQTVGQWLRQGGVSSKACQMFWSVVLVSALAETLDRISLDAARKVFVEGLLASPEAYRMRVPRVPLGEIFDRRLGRWLERVGVQLYRGRRVRRVVGTGTRADALVTADGRRLGFDLFIVAVPWHRVASVVAGLGTAVPGLDGLGQMDPCGITAVHLWLDRPIMSLADAVLVGRLGQWVFNGGWRAWPGGGRAQYLQVVISASHDLEVPEPRQLVCRVRSELASIWPQARGANLLAWRVVTHRRAVFSCRPHLDRLRPIQQTPIPNLFLAGDWTATGWPATMEGAVRSGYLAAEAALRHLGVAEAVLAPDVRPSRLARRLFAAG